MSGGDEVGPDVVAITVDVEWASPEVLADIVAALDERSITGTFFCTHPGIDVGRHERALHPNFRRHGETVRALRESSGPSFDALSDEELYRRVVARTLAFAPEARGLRAHSLFYDSVVLQVYREAGLRYDSTYSMPLVPRLAPFLKEYDIVELPVFYIDHYDLKAGATGFELGRLGLDRPGMKVFGFHPNIVYVNARTNDDYLGSKAIYHDPAALRASRRAGRGIRTLFLELLDEVGRRGLETRTLAAIDAAWRTRNAPRPG